MKKGNLTKLSWGCLLCLLIAMAGCCVDIGCWPRAKYQRTDELYAPLEPGSTFAAQTHNGSITITGADVTDCNLTATIIARSATEEGAKKLAERIKITLEPVGDRLIVRIEKPAFMMNQSVTVNLNVTVPNQTSLELTTHNGAVEITNIAGQTNATTHNGRVTASHISGNAALKTHNGSITCKQISGDMNLRTHNGRVTASHISGNTALKTHNGSVTCKLISGDMNLRTHNGSVKVFYSETAPPICDISIVTHNGGIDFTAPTNLSAETEISTHNGSINTDLPITIIGKLTKRKLTGKVGAGEGKLRLETHNGSIKIK